MNISSSDVAAFLCKSQIQKKKLSFNLSESRLSSCDIGGEFALCLINTNRQTARKSMRCLNEKIFRVIHCLLLCPFPSLPVFLAFVFKVMS